MCMFQSIHQFSTVLVSLRRLSTAAFQDNLLQTATFKLRNNCSDRDDPGICYHRTFPCQKCVHSSAECKDICPSIYNALISELLRGCETYIFIPRIICSGLIHVFQHDIPVKVKNNSVWSDPLIDDRRSSAVKISQGITDLFRPVNDFIRILWSLNTQYIL